MGTIFKNLLLTFTLFVCSTECEKILGLFQAAGISHNILYSKLMKGLSEAGHNVTVVSPYPVKDLPKNGTYTEVILKGVSETFQKTLQKNNLFKQDTRSTIEKLKTMANINFYGVNETLHHPYLKKLIDDKEKFDLVVIEQFFNDALKVYGYLFDCPVVVLHSQGPNSWINPTVGNPQPYSYIPHMFSKWSGSGSFFQRLDNLMQYLIEYYVTNYYILPKHQEMIQGSYPNAPSIFDLYTNVSLVLLNSHTSFYPAVPTVPNMVEIGGYFIDPPKKLPEDLQRYMDDATNGVVYFSMGSNLRSQDLPAEKKRVFLNVLGRLKQKVIWKFEEVLEDVPPNIMIRKWIPQQDILAHKNIKLFITHGGLLSTIETIYHGVPILAIPVFGDQPTNAANAVRGGYALRLDYNDPDFSEEKLEYLIDELLNNPVYRENAQHKSTLFHDRPLSPMDTAVYWVEYVIKHKGAKHLRVAGADLPWYQYFLVDVLFFLVASRVVLVIGIKIVWGKLFHAKKPKVKTN